MIFSVYASTKTLDRLQGESFADLGLLERQDLHEWVIEDPCILGEELLIIASEYQNFEQTHDLLALTSSRWIQLASVSSSN